MSARDSSADRSARAGTPLLALSGRYRAVLGHAWENRAALAAVKRRPDEAEFLPAALSLQDTPVHPAPRLLAAAIMALFAITVAWACTAQLDVVAVAPGRIVVSERTKWVQPLERSVVKAVLVRDGDRVSAGQPLVELDATGASADRLESVDQSKASLSELLRAQALVKLLQSGSGHLSDPVAPGSRLAMASQIPADWSRSDADALHAQVQAEWRDVRARLSRYASELARRKAEMATAHELLAKLEAVLPLARAREADYQKLVDQGYLSVHARLDKTRERVELERDAATQRARVAEAQAALAESESGRAAYMAEVGRDLSQRETQGRLKVRLARQEQAKAVHKESLSRLTAPVAGVVQQLAVHSVGGVVTEAQVLMVIVPDNSGVTAEVTMDNKDIGFVNAGQSAEIKLETFPFTRYGTLPAKVERVTSDAVNDDKRGAIFPAILSLNTDRISIDGKWIRLSPGMNVSAEIKTGRRRVIDYLLSPIQRAGKESLRER